MRNLIEYDHLSIDGRMSGDSWWAGQKDIVPNDNHFAYQLRLLSSAVGLVLGRATYEGFPQTRHSRADLHTKPVSPAALATATKGTT